MGDAVRTDTAPFLGPSRRLFNLQLGARQARRKFSAVWAYTPLKDFDWEAHGREVPAWDPVSPKGFREQEDAPVHTDWVLSAGLRNGEEYGLLSGRRTSYAAAVARSVCQLQFDLVREFSSADFVALARGRHKRIEGEVVFARPNHTVPAGSVAIAPTAGVEYQAAMVAACRPGPRGPGAIICEQGSQLAHLAKVSRELDCTVLMLPRARRRFAPGTMLLIDMSSRRLVPLV